MSHGPTWRERQPTLADRFLAVLSDGEWHTGTELHQRTGHRFGDRVLILRKRGWDVESERLHGDGSVWRFRLKGRASKPYVTKGSRAELCRLRLENERLRARVAELEGRP